MFAHHHAALSKLRRSVNISPSSKLEAFAMTTMESDAEETSLDVKHFVSSSLRKSFPWMRHASVEEIAGRCCKTFH